MQGDGELVVVTGGASGIGAGAVAALIEAGFRPLVVDLRPPPAADRQAMVWETPLDVSDAEAVAAGVAAIEERHGPMFGLVNAAGILGRMHPPERIKLDNWNRELAVDLTGVFLMAREAGVRMAQRGRGAIVNIASVAGMLTVPAHAYAVAKAGVIHLTASLAADWGPRGVRVNAVSPGFTRTPGLQAGLATGALQEDLMTRHTPLGRLVEPIEIGRAAAWLIGPGSSAVTGANLPVDGGFLAGASWGAYGGFRE